MKKKLIYILLGLILSIGLIQAQEAKQAKVYIKEKVYDFGDIMESKGSVSHEFELMNVGIGPLVIQRVATSCGCTVAKYSEEPIAPGKKTTLTITFNPKGRSGHFSRSSSVYTNGEIGITTIVVKGNIIND